jgi:hypothetical protein
MGDECLKNPDGHRTRRSVLVAFCPDAERASLGLTTLMDKDSPMDRISLLGQANASGDDSLGVNDPRAGERLRRPGGRTRRESSPGR